MKSTPKTLSLLGATCSVAWFWATVRLPLNP